MKNTENKFIELSDLQLVVLNGSKVDEKLESYYDKAFQHWHKVWSDHFRERDGLEKYFSDNFTRQDEIFALFYKGECLSAVCSRLVDLNRKSFKFDSYFEPWLFEDIEKLKKYGNKVVICSQISVEPNIPKINDKIKVKDLMVYLKSRHLKNTEISSFTGTARKDKNMHGAFAKFGATLIRQDVEFHGGFVDIMAFYPSLMNVEVDLAFKQCADFVWNRKIGNLVINEINHEGKAMSPKLESFIKLHEEKMKSIDEILSEYPWEDKFFYASWCQQFYYFVCHATRLLSAAACRLSLDKDSMHIRFLDHMQEEKHHEKLFEKDLKNMGFAVDHWGELPVTSQLYQSQYYLIDYENPVALMGSIFYLEGMSITSGPKVLQRILQSHGSDACSFMKVHVGEDVGHIKKAVAALQSLNEKDLDSVFKSYLQTAYLFESLIYQLVNSKAKDGKGLMAA